MNSGIQILEKPDWVSWEDIHNVLWKAHEENRERGVFMRYPSLSGEEIREMIEGKGKMFVVMDGVIPVGTAAYLEKTESLWCGNGLYGYYCFASLLPSYRNKGIYPKLCEVREKELLDQGINRIIMDTHRDNIRELELAKKQGFIPIDYVERKNHFGVVLVKWLDGCPYPLLICKVRFLLGKYFHMQYLLYLKDKLLL